MAVFLILLLLLNPLIRKVDNDIERPLVVVGVDNSSSIQAIHDNEELGQLKESLDDLIQNVGDANDYRMVWQDLEGNADSLGYDDPVTDVSKFLDQVGDDFSGENLASVVLLSDGIYNRGASPAYRSFRYPVYTLGLGDTLAQKDAAIVRVRHNEVAYSGNEFPVRIELSGEAYAGKRSDVRISEKGKRLLSFDFEWKNEKTDTTVFLQADEEGLKHYTISLSGFDDELTKENNRHDMFIEVLESQKKVLISGRSPHPDMRAIRTALEQTGNYEIEVFIPGINEKPESKGYDVQILFDGSAPVKDNSGVWLINSSETGQHLNLASFLRVSTQGRPDNVVPALNKEFSTFKLTTEVAHLNGYPPVQVPFGDYQLSGPYEILLYQQVGSVQTEKPLLAVYDDGNKKMAVSLGTGMWQWKLQEAARYGNHEVYDELVQKLVQFLSIDENKKQFRVKPGQDFFTEGERVFFDVEIYDEIFESLEGQPYGLSITNETDETQNFNFVFGSGNKTASTTTLPAGTYSYTASTSVGGKRLEDKGEFVVNALQLELKQLQADHDILRRVSDKSGGKYYHLSQLDELESELLDSDFQGIIHSDVNRQPLISVLWVLLLIAGLLAMEWVLRKAWGAY